MKFWILLIGVFIVASCSTTNELFATSATIPMDASLSSNQRIDSLVAPYKKSLDEEMNEVIAKALDNFIPERPSGTLNNWAADAVLASQIAKARLEAPTICILNTGGLRTSINKGEVTIGDIFKVMPFDNEIVWVKMPVSSIPDIEDYMKLRNGEPIAGAKIVNGKLLINGLSKGKDHFWIITSDYLMNGGDNMTFFEQSLERSYTGILLRDAMIDQAREQKELVPTEENRMQF